MRYHFTTKKLQLKVRTGIVPPTSLSALSIAGIFAAVFIKCLEKVSLTFSSSYFAAKSFGTEAMRIKTTTDLVQLGSTTFQCASGGRHP
jgi:hypothetical protein